MILHRPWPPSASTALAVPLAGMEAVVELAAQLAPVGRTAAVVEEHTALGRPR